MQPYLVNLTTRIYARSPRDARERITRAWNTNLSNLALLSTVADSELVDEPPERNYPIAEYDTYPGHPL